MPQNIEISQTKGPLRKGEVTRQLLLAAARTVFVREGYMNAEISQITKEAGKSNGVFYTYFENKDDLLRNLIDEFSQDIRGKAISKPKNAPEDVRTILQAIWTTYKVHAATFLALAEASIRDPAFAEIYHAIRNYAKEDFENMIKARQRLGYCSGLHADLTAKALDTMVNACLYEWLAQGVGEFQNSVQENLAFETLAHIIQVVLDYPKKR